MELEWTITLLMLIGFSLMILEAFTPSFGILGVGGLAAYFAGLFLLRHLDTIHGVPVDAPLLISMAIVGAIALAIVVYCVRLAWRKRITFGAETLIGMTAVVADWADKHGFVHIEGETWQAAGPYDLVPGTPVRITHRHNLTLHVEPLPADGGHTTPATN